MICGMRGVPAPHPGRGTLHFCSFSRSVLVRVAWRRQGGFPGRNREQGAVAGDTPHMSCSPCPCSPSALGLPISGVFRGRGDTGSVLGWGEGCWWASPAPHLPLGFLQPSAGGRHGGARAEQGCGELTEAARPPFRIDEGSGGTGVALLAASPAAGLQMGSFKWGWEGRSVWEEGSQSHEDSVTPLVPYLSGGAGSCFLHSRFGFFPLLPFFSFSLVFAPSELLASSDLGWVPGWGAGCMLRSHG